MATKSVKRGLGKGLDSIIPAKVSTSKKEVPEEKHVEGQVVTVNITKIDSETGNALAGAVLVIKDASG